MQFGRTPIIAVIATCAAAIAATGGLALARGDDPPVARPAQAGTPPAAYTKSRSTAGPRIKAAKWRRVVAFSIPDGQYLVLGSATLGSESFAGSDCRLRGAGQGLAVASQDLARTPGSGTRSTVTVQFTGATGGVVELQCRANRTWFPTGATLSAVAVTLVRGGGGP